MNFKESREKIKQSSLLTMLPFKEDLLEDYEFYLEGLIVKGVNKDKIKEGNQLYFVFAQFKRKELDFLNKINSEIKRPIEKVSSFQFETFLLNIKNKLKEEIGNNKDVFKQMKFNKKEIKKDKPSILEEIEEISLKENSILESFTTPLDKFSRKELKEFKESIIRKAPETSYIKRLINHEKQKEDFLTGVINVYKKVDIRLFSGFSSKNRCEYILMTIINKETNDILPFVIFNENKYRSISFNSYSEAEEEEKERFVLKQVPFNLSNRMYSKSINLTNCLYASHLEYPLRKEKEITPNFYTDGNSNSVLILNQFEMIYAKGWLDKMDTTYLTINTECLKIPYKDKSIGFLTKKANDEHFNFKNQDLRVTETEHLFSDFNTIRNNSISRESKMYIEFDNQNYFEILKTFYIDHTIYIGFKDGNLKFYGLVNSGDYFFEYKWKEYKGIKQSDIPKDNIKKIEWVNISARRKKYWLLKISYSDNKKPIFLVEDYTLRKISCYSLDIGVKEFEDLIKNEKLNPLDIIRK